MPARSLLTLPVLASLLLAVAGRTAAAGASRLEADPHELYERALSQLEKGNLGDAAATATRLHNLVTTRPEWDPEGTFAHTLLPPLQSRLKRLQSAARALDEFHDEALRDLKPPDLTSEISTVRDYTHWATSVVQRLRADRDALIDASLKDPEEKAILGRTESYAGTERLFEDEVLKQMAEKAGDDVLGLLSGDPNLESVLVRFRQLKRDLMEAIAERDRLQEQVREAEHRRQALLAALAAITLDADAPAPAGKEGATKTSPGARFTRLLAEEREKLRGHPPVTPPERTALEARLERLRLSNKVLTAARLTRDQSEDIAQIGRLVAAVPDLVGPTAPRRGAGWIPWMLAAVLAAAAGVFARLAWLRGRRLDAIEARLSRFDHTVPADGGAGAGRHAA